MKHKIKNTKILQLTEINNSIVAKVLYKSH